MRSIAMHWSSDDCCMRWNQFRFFASPLSVKQQLLLILLGSCSQANKILKSVELYIACHFKTPKALKISMIDLCFLRCLPTVTEVVSLNQLSVRLLCIKAHKKRGFCLKYPLTRETLFFWI